MLGAGYVVVGIDVDGEALRREAGGFAPGDFHGVEGDVADTGLYNEIAALTRGLGVLQCWVNNAGFATSGAAHETAKDDYDRAVAVYLTGPFWGTATAAREMIAHGRGGSIVNMSSIHAHVGFPNIAVYAMCKSGVNGLTRQTASEYGHHGIRVNAIAPGVIDTPTCRAGLLAGLSEDAVTEEAWDWSVLGRTGRPADIAEMVHFLAREETARFITGPVLPVDDGMLGCRPGF
jgi:3-oxoacyl-[acyl-carrier protein] reductase